MPVESSWTKSSKSYHDNFALFHVFTLLGWEKRTNLWGNCAQNYQDPRREKHNYSRTFGNTTSSWTKSSKSYHDNFALFHVFTLLGWEKRTNLWGNCAQNYQDPRREKHNYSRTFGNTTHNLLLVFQLYSQGKSEHMKYHALFGF